MTIARGQMAMISPKAQALINRLHAVDIARPRLDGMAVEIAFNRHLLTLGQPARPIRHMPDASSGYRYMIDMADAASRPEATRAAQDAVRSTWHRRSLAARNAAHGLALHISREVSEDPAYHEALGSAVSAAVDAAGDGGERRKAARTAAHEVAMEATSAIVLLEAKWAARDAIWQADGSTNDDIWSAAYHVVTDDTGALTSAVGACEELNALSTFDHPTQQHLVDIWLPMLDAFEAGLFFYWVTPREIVWVSRPSLSIANGHMHSIDGPAVEWATGERYWFWRGTPVPQWLIEDPSRITHSVIRSESNHDLQRCMIERLGGERNEHESGSIWQALMPRRWRR